MPLSRCPDQTQPVENENAVLLLWGGVGVCLGTDNEAELDDDGLEMS